MFIPILASVSRRQLPWPLSADSRRQWDTISTYIVAMQRTMYVGRGRLPKCMARYLHRITALSDAYSDFSFRQIPEDSAASRWAEAPYPHIFPGCRQQCIWEGCRRPKLHGATFTKIRDFRVVYPNFAPRQLPWDSSSFRGGKRTRIRLYSWEAGNIVRKWDAGSQSSWSDIYVKLEFSATFILILASVSFR